MSHAQTFPIYVKEKIFPSIITSIRWNDADSRVQETPTINLTQSRVYIYQLDGPR